MPSSQFLNIGPPTPENFSQVLTEIYTRYQAVEEVRWNESNTDTRFWAGDQNYIYEYFQFQPNTSAQNFYFNIIQQPCNMVSGYQRQHRKSINFVPVENSDQKTSDQFNEVLTYANNKRLVHEKFSNACEKSMVASMVLTQPFLDYTQDPTNGDLDLKVWDYNSFMMDPYWREPDMSDCNWVWIQKYISKEEALSAFPEHTDIISTMSGYNNRNSRFYFLPENYNIARNNLLVLSYYWYRTTRRKKVLYNRETGEITEFKDSPENITEYLEVFTQLEQIEVDAPTWMVGVMLNETQLYMGPNPLGFDECPFVPVYWNYDPEIAQYNLRTRSLVRTLRDSQFLFNRRIILNHDISESSLNTGWIYKENMLVNEDALSKQGQGQNIIMKEDAEMSDISKIIPNAVPPSDMELAKQLLDIIPSLSGVNQELMGMATDDNAGITEILRQGAGLVTLQKYFDQWDRALKQIGKVEMSIIQRNWSPFKIARIIEEEPTEQFFTKNFQNYDIQITEGLNTVVQRQQQFAQALEFQRATEIKLPPDYLLDISTLQGKDDLIEKVMQAQQQAQEMQQQQMQLDMAAIEQKLQNTQADTVQKLALAKERVGRTKSNVGLFEERLSEVTENRARALREKVLAIKEILDTVDKYGQPETLIAAQTVERIEQGQERKEDVEKIKSQADEQSQPGNLASKIL